ncbi:hypothetical protein XF35_21290 [Streptomyces platensis subsp. clarensis]|nr:hypothetical protein [Streptomyces platensis subsp. clarensis]
MAVSPPATTTMSRWRKKNLSQVVHHETPRPDSSSSLGRPSLRYAEPVATITVLARYAEPAESVRSWISPVRSTETMSSSTNLGAKLLGPGPRVLHLDRAVDSFGEAGSSPLRSSRGEPLAKRELPDSNGRSWARRCRGRRCIRRWPEPMMSRRSSGWVRERGGRAHPRLGVGEFTGREARKE